MKIWIVGVGEPLPSDEGNVRLRRNGLLSSRLTSEGHEVHWFSASFHHYKKVQRCSKDCDIVINERLTVHLIKANGYKKNVSMSRVIHHWVTAKKFSIMSKSFEKPDIILSGMTPIELCEEVLKYGVKNDIPVIVDIRDLWPKIFDEVVPKWAVPFIKPYIMYNSNKLGRILRKTTAMVAVTPQFLNYGLDIANISKREKDRVFFTAYKPQDLSKELDNFKEEWSSYGLNEANFIVTFMGNFGKQFELDPVIQAAESLKEYKNIKFVLCGDGENFERIKKRTKNSDNIILPGWIEEKKILSLLAASSVGIAPYRHSINFTHNSTNKFGEYLALSLPILIGVEGFMADLVSENNCGMKYNNSNELANSIITLFNDYKLLKNMSNNAFELYNRKFNSDNVYNDYSKYLEDIAKNYKENFI